MESLLRSLTSKVKTVGQKINTNNAKSMLNQFACLGNAVMENGSEDVDVVSMIRKAKRILDEQILEFLT